MAATSTRSLPNQIVAMPGVLPSLWAQMLTLQRVHLPAHYPSRRGSGAPGCPWLLSLLSWRAGLCVPGAAGSPLGWTCGTGQHGATYREQEGSVLTLKGGSLKVREPHLLNPLPVCELDAAYFLGQGYLCSVGEFHSRSLQTLG